MPVKTPNPFPPAFGAGFLRGFWHFLSGGKIDLTESNRVHVMPIYLEAPSYSPTGPDGQGRNRLRIDTIEPKPRCALRPKTYAALRESQNTMLAQWSASFDLCSGTGNCSACPRLSHRFTLEAFTSEVMVRIDKDGRLHVMNRPEDGWASYGEFLSWEDVAAIDGWRIGRTGIDLHSQFFMLHRV